VTTDAWWHDDGEGLGRPKEEPDCHQCTDSGYVRRLVRGRTNCSWCNPTRWQAFHGRWRWRLGELIYKLTPPPLRRWSKDDPPF
jgi:hypothetical protein